MSVKKTRRYVVIVDAFSSARGFPAEFRKFGYFTLHVQSSGRIPKWYGKPCFSDFAHHWVFDGNFEKLLERLRSFRIDAVLNGTDIGLSLADRLAFHLNTPNNGTQFSQARRNKYLQNQVLGNAGVPVARSFASSHEKQLRDWASKQGCWPVVIKPLESSGSDGIYFARNSAEITSAFYRLHDRENGDGGCNAEIMAQEYVEGVEYAVDFVSARGRHLVTDVWRYHCTSVVRPGGERASVRSFNELVPIEETPDALISYGKRVLDTLQYQTGPSHLEIMMTSVGPKLVELNPRIVGGNLPIYVEQAGGENALRVTAEALLAYDCFRGRLERSPRRTQPARLVQLISRTTGVIDSVRHLEDLIKLASYRSHRILGRDECLQLTLDLESCPGLIYLTHKDHRQIERDYKQIRAWEKEGLFEISPNNNWSSKRFSEEPRPA